MMNNPLLRPHKTVEKEVNGQQVFALELTENPYSGIIVSYNKVSFTEDEKNDKLKIHFDYEVHRHNDQDYDIFEFEQYLGDFLQELIRHGVTENNLVYTGGTDDDREDDISEFDLQ